MDKYKLFKSLHKSNTPLFLGNFHDLLSAMILEKAGFKAIGTTSWGIANTLGYNDGEKINFHDYLFIIRNIIKHISIPVSVDIESGYSQCFADIVKNTLLIAECGIVGINIEDSLKDDSKKLRNIKQHCDLLHQLRIALEKEGFKDFFINARTDTYLTSCKDPLKETIARGRLYAQTGVDGLFVPGLTKATDIKELIQEINIPLNLISLPNFTKLDVLWALGVRRFSFGNALSDKLIADMELVASNILQFGDTSVLYKHQAIKMKFIDNSSV